MKLAEEGYSFSIDMPWEAHLAEHGFVVVRGVLDAAALARAEDGFWSCVEASHPAVRRDAPVSWASWRVDGRGIMLDGSLLHCAGAWEVRGAGRVQEAFARVWGERDLIASFDSTLVWKPFGKEAAGRPRVEGLHMDQNPFNKPGRSCVQGMVPLYDVTEATGGLAVVPDSHEDEQIAQRHKYWRGGSDFCMLMGKDPCYGKQRLVLARAGDLILWDSRTVHGGHVGTGEGLNPARLARLTQTVCMVPRAWASKEVLEWRREAFQNGTGTTHWPQEMNESCHAQRGYVPLVLNEDQKKVL